MELRLVLCRHSLLCVSVYCLLFVRSSCALSYPSDYGPKLCTEDEIDVFDFIVCGAGSAGSTVASRLSEIADLKILLLERGDDPDASTNSPIAWEYVLKSDIDYQYKSQTDENLFKGLAGQVSHIPRGKVSGGCSTINACGYMRGHPNDYAKWAEGGQINWNYLAAIPYFKKAEAYFGTSPYKNLHGTEGPLLVESPTTNDPAYDVFTRGYREMGLQRMKDLNGPKPLGYGSFDMTAKNGVRSSTFRTYISAASSNTNLKFARNVLVKKVVIESKKATGVEILAPNGKSCVVSAKREVILSMGAIVTPQILMLSGIGPKTVLQKMGIPLVADLPVGRNYQDHLAYYGCVFSEGRDWPKEKILAKSQKISDDFAQLLAHNVTTQGLGEMQVFMDTTNSSTFPNALVEFVRYSLRSMYKTPNGKHSLYNVFGLSAENADLYTELNDRTDILMASVVLMKPKSAGYLELRSTNAAHHPEIYPQFLREKEDEDAMLEVVEFVQRLAQTKALNENGFRLEHINFAACSKTKPFSKEYWRCGFRQIGTGFYHPCCTAKMGAENDDSAVLTSRLRVKGVDNLRVVDASAFATQVSGHLNAVVIMMAEKLCDILKQDWHL